MGREQPRYAFAESRADTARFGPIVSSAHLALGLHQGYPRSSSASFLQATRSSGGWCVAWQRPECPSLSAVEVLVLHTVRHRDRPKKLADICLVLGIEDTHVVAYAVKKLALAGLVSSRRAGKEKLVVATKEGADACQRYHEVRERLLVAPVKSTGLPDPILSELGALSAGAVGSLRSGGEIGNNPVAVEEWEA